MQPNPSPRRSLLILVAGIVAFVALLTYTVGWALPLVIFAIIFIVMAHEFGHYITAKRAGMKVTDFFVGFGPVLWSTTIGETRYGVRAILAGGYVKVPGMNWTEEIPADEEARTYRSASYPRKAIFASAGSIMHLFMALVLAWAALTFVGLPSQDHVGIGGFAKWPGHSKDAAQLAGLKTGDRIMAIDGRPMKSATQLISTVERSSGRRLTLLVNRNGRDITLHATPVDGRTIKSGSGYLTTGTKAHGYLGITLVNLPVRDSWYGAIPSSFTEVGSLIGTAATAIAELPSKFEGLAHQVASPAAANNPTNQRNRPESIVGIARIAVQSTSDGVGNLFIILMAVNIFVGLLNMLPMLPLDGGYVAIATYERIRTRRGRRRYEADLNKMAPFAYAFMGALLFLFACTLYLDIAHPIANPF